VFAVRSSTMGPTRSCRRSNIGNRSCWKASGGDA
jgi:hypothetical protein